MEDNPSKRSCALVARGFVALWGAALVAAFSALPADAAPFAYVANAGTFSVPGNTVSVIDTATNTVTATVVVGSRPEGVAVAPDGKFVYVANFGSNNVSVIAAAGNTVTATVAVGSFPIGVAVTPDGKFVYVANNGSNNVSVIATATNTVVATVSFLLSDQFPVEIAIAPDGQHAYVTSNLAAADHGAVAVIATASNTVVATVPVGSFESAAQGIAITPDGKHAYVAGETTLNMGSPAGRQAVFVIDTASNTVVATVLGGGDAGPPRGVAVTPDGTRAYVADFFVPNRSGTVAVIDTATNMVVTTVTTVTAGFPGVVAITPDGKSAYVTGGSNGVAVIDTASNTVVDTIPVGNGPGGVGIIPDIPFRAFSAKLAIEFGSSPNTDACELLSEFTLGQKSNRINPPVEPVTLQAGTFAATIPPGSFKGHGFGPFFFVGQVGGVDLEVLIVPTGAKRYAFLALALNANLTGTVNPVRRCGIPSASTAARPRSRPGLCTGSSQLRIDGG